MADELTSYTSGQADVIWEDVEGAIQNITPHKTPFISSIGKKAIDQHKHEWLETTLATPDGTNAAEEGADATNTARIVPSRLYNYTGIIEDTFTLTGTAGAEKAIGRSSLYKEYLSDSLKYLNTELEYQAINNLTTNAHASGTAGRFKGMAGFITTNDESYASYATTNSFTTAKLLAMSKDIWEQADEGSHNLLVGATTANDIASWTQDNRITVNTDASAKKLVMAVMVLETPFGQIQIVLDRYLAQTADSGNTNYYRSAYMYVPSKFSIGWLRNWKNTELAKTGDARKFQTVGEMTVICHSEKAAANCDKLFDAVV